MARIALQSTAYTIAVFMTDSTDHVTGKTGASGTMAVTASKNGGAFASISPTISELSNGWYTLALTTTHTNTLGDLALHITGTGCDPSDMVVQIIPFDMFSTATPTVDATKWGGTAVASAYVQSNVEKWNGTAVATPTTAGVPRVDVKAMEANVVTAAAVADGAIDRATFAQDAKDLFAEVRRNTAQGGASSSITLDASASSTTDFYVGCKVLLVGGTGSGQVRTITAYNGTTKVATVDVAWATTPDNTSVFELIGEVTTLIGNVAGSVGSVTGNVGGNVTGSVGSVASGGITSSSFASGAITATSIAANAITAAKVATDAIGAAQLAADAVTEIQSGLATTSGLGDVAANVWEELRASHSTPGSYGEAVAGVQGNVVGDVQGDVTGNVLGSVASVDTGGITSASFASGAITAAAIAADAITAAKVAADVGTEIAAAVWDAVMEGTYSAKQMMRGYAAALLGKAAGFAGTSRTFRDTGDTKDRITATVDSSGRTAVTLDLT